MYIFTLLTQIINRICNLPQSFINIYIEKIEKIYRKICRAYGFHLLPTENSNIVSYVENNIVSHIGSQFENNIEIWDRILRWKLIYIGNYVRSNIGYKLNKQSGTMFPGWSRSNNSQAKALTTVPKAAWHQGVVSSTVSPGNQVVSWSIKTLPLHAGLCRGWLYTSLAVHGNDMETNNLNKSMCEDLFGGKYEVTVESDYIQKSNTRRQKDCL